MHLTVATALYDRIAALRDGRVRPEGIELEWLTLRVEEIFWRMMRHYEFDLSEISLSGYVLQRSRGVERLIAIPVFLSRTFRHSSLYVGADSGIERPEDLTGRRIGVPEYQITAAVWVRGILADEHGVRAQDCEWIQGGLEQPGRVPFEPVEPSGVSLEFAPPGKTLAGMLAAGELDALISPRTPSNFAEDGSGAVRRLFPEPWAAERDYYARTGIFPIMHTVALRQDVFERDRWIAASLFKGFLEAKRLAMEALVDTTAVPVSLPFLLEHARSTVELMGEDFWPYGIEQNRLVLETFARYLAEQGLVDEAPPIESWFAEPTRQMRLGI